MQLVGTILRGKNIFKFYKKGVPKNIISLLNDKNIKDLYLAVSEPHHAYSRINIQLLKC